MGIKWNKQQQQAIEFFEGACAVIAQAGAGKSTILTNRVNNLVYNHNVKQEDILTISFTRNTADELEKKLAKMGCGNVNIGTFHSICGRILAIEGIDVTKRIQDWEMENIFKGIDKEADTKDIQSFIGYQKNYMRTYKDSFVKKDSEYSEEELRVFFKAYEEYKSQKHLYDFEDWLIECYKILKEKPNKHTFDFVLVDEHQDTNLVQNLLLRELCPKGNVFCVFDYRQCFPKGTQVRTDNGFKNIEDIKENNDIIVANGRGGTITTKVSEVMRKRYIGKLIEIKTESGQVVKATPNHTMFLNTLIEGGHFVYLMYKEGMGFRIGRSSLISCSRNNKVSNRNGYELRLTTEKANKVWLIKSCTSLEESIFYENYYAFEYGIPLYVFNNKNRKGILKQDMIDKLFNSMDTYSRGHRLLKDLSMYFEHPHYTPQANATDSDGNTKQRLNFVMFGNSRKGLGKKDIYIGNKHELSFSTINEEFAKISSEKFISGVTKQVNGIGYEYFVGRKVTNNQDELLNIAYSIQEDLENVEIDCRAVLTNEEKVKFKFMPMANAKVGMGVPVFKDGQIVEDKIIEINTYEYDDYVYDLNVDLYRNYIVNDIVVHNCIYAFRGGNPEYCMNFHKEWKNATVINLDINYRSCKNIVENANGFIKKYYGDYEYYSDGVANNKEDGKITIDSYLTKETEATDVANKIEELLQNGEELNEIAVLYRLNANSSFIENELKSRGVPYDISNDSSFFKRKEISAIMSYLRLVDNPHDDNAFETIFRLRNYPLQYFSNNILENIRVFSGQNNLSLYESFTMISLDKVWQKRNVNDFVNNINKLRLQLDKEVSIQTLIDNIVKVFKLEDFLKEKYTNKEEFEDRMEAMRVLKSFIKGGDVKHFISYVYNTGINEKKKTPKDSVKLLSIHASKGLEWKHTFVIGVEDGKFPHCRSNFEDEARLFYVAVTRAEENLYLSEIGVSNKFINEYPLKRKLNKPA